MADSVCCQVCPQPHSGGAVRCGIGRLEACARGVGQPIGSCSSVALGVVRTVPHVICHRGVLFSVAVLLCHDDLCRQRRRHAGFAWPRHTHPRRGCERERRQGRWCEWRRREACEVKWSCTPGASTLMAWSVPHRAPVAVGWAPPGPQAEHAPGEGRACAQQGRCLHSASRKRVSERSPCRPQLCGAGNGHGTGSLRQEGSSDSGFLV